VFVGPLNTDDKGSALAIYTLPQIPMYSAWILVAEPVGVAEAPSTRLITEAVVCDEIIATPGSYSGDFSGVGWAPGSNLYQLIDNSIVGTSPVSSAEGSYGIAPDT